MHKKLRGTGVAIVTPFHKDGSIDFGCLEKLVEHLINNNIDYIVVMGTTGESVTLNKDEKMAVIGFIVETVNGRIPVVMGLGGNNTQEVINCIKSFDFDGVDAILSVSPYYNKPSQRGLYQHYKIIANASPVPVILYNVPGRTSVNITAETTLKLANDLDNIIGIKEASGDLVQCMTIINNKPDGFLVISGDDALTLPIIAIGGDGVISVVANAFPKELSEMVYHALRGNLKIARDIHYKLIDIIENLFIDGNPAGIKAALDILNFCSDNLRLPLVSVSRSTYNKLSTLIEEVKKAEEVVSTC
ncbi:MAG: 4-hydroxy-tetrahydrodipicolinate synthase [Bacteroidota bacterium]